MQDAWRAYLEMALGLTQAPRKKAQKAVGDLVNRGGATAAQLQGLVEDLMSTGMANREALTNIVRYEVDRTLGVVGLATSEEVADLTGRVRDLEKQLREAQARVAAAEAASPTAPAPTTGGAAADDGSATPVVRPAKKVAKKAVAKKASPAVKAAPTVKKATPAKASPTKTATATTGTPVAKKAVAKKTVAKKTVAKKTAADKSAVSTPPEVRP